MDYFFFLYEKMSAFTSPPFPSKNRMKELKKNIYWERFRNNVDNVEEKIAILLVGLFGKFMAGS